MLKVIRPQIIRYGVAILSVLLALILNVLLEPFIDKKSLALFFAAVAVSNWYGGFKAGLLATIVSVLLHDYFFLSPIHAINIFSLVNLVSTVVFLFVSLLISSLTTELKTAKNRVENSLLEAEAERKKVVNILESITDAFISFDNEWRFIYINEQAIRLLQKTHQELIGKQIWQELPPDIFGELAYEKLHRAVTEKVTVKFENFAESMGIWLEIHAYPSVDGLAVYFRDISERKQMEEERRRHLLLSEENTSKLENLAEISLMINSSLSVKEILQLITKESRKSIGADQSIIIIRGDEDWQEVMYGVSHSDKYPQQQRLEQELDSLIPDIIFCSCNRYHIKYPVRLTQAELESDLTCRIFAQKISHYLPLRNLLVQPIVNIAGKKIGVIQLHNKYKGDFTKDDENILLQISQLASLAINNAHLYEESQRANRMKDEFLAMLSHELRSPLNAILGWSQLLRSGKLNQEKTIYGLETIERNTKLQAQLIEDLLDISRILSGKISLNISSLDPVLPIKAAINTMYLAAAEKSVQLLPAIDLNVGMISGDSKRVQQITWNLLSNAIKFTPGGGLVKIQLTAIDSQVQIKVIDTGKGIKADFLPNVFERFRQADASITRSYGGLGLGLAIVHQLVELQGGTVKAESLGEGQGSTFTVRLPLLKQQIAIEPISTFSNQSGNINGVKVLIVDDNIDTMDILIFILEEQGAIALGKASARQGMDCLQQFQPDIIVSDIGMPGEDGYSFIRKVRELKSSKFQELPAIALTAYASTKDSQQALDAGFQKHLTKPIDTDELITTISHLVTALNQNN
jgi:PAS domain S-box-containing protein